MNDDPVRELAVARRSSRNPLGKLRHALLKRKARRAYKAMQAIADNYDCGLHLLRIISSDYRRAEEIFERTRAELRAIDPSAPHG